MADEQELQIDQGAYWSVILEWQDENEDPIDNSGYTARMQIRRKITSEDPLVELTDGDGITLGGIDGTITLALTATQTADLPATPTDHRWYYDVEMVPPNGHVVRLLQGRVLVDPEVTRA